MTNLIVRPADHALDRAERVYLANKAPGTVDRYTRRISEWRAWMTVKDRGKLVEALQDYRAHLEAIGNAPRTVKNKLVTIKKLLRTAAALDPSLAAALPQLDLVETPRVSNEVQGKRLSFRQAHTLIHAPDTTTAGGLRDTAILSLMTVCGLRRSEVATLTWDHLSVLDDVPVILNLEGKYGVRTVKLPRWLDTLLDAWHVAAGFEDADMGVIFVPVHKSGAVHLQEQPMTTKAIYKLVIKWCKRAGVPVVKPHDLRRTAAALSRRGGASIEQVQIMLGHKSPQTTSQYIGEQLKLDDHAVDYNALEVGI